MRRLLLACLLAMAVVVVAIADGQETRGAATSATNVDLVPDLPSGQPVGTTITWIATADGPDPLEYRLSIGLTGDPLRVMYDFSARNVFPWTPIDDGTYNVVASVRDADSGEITHVAKTYVVESRVRQTPIVTGTEHPLVAFYSAPPCQSGEMRVVFRRWGAKISYSTSSKPCDPGRSMNFYVAGMRANSTYSMRHEVVDGDGVLVEQGPLRLYRTGSLQVSFPGFTVLDGPDPQTSLEEPVLLQALRMPGDVLPFHSIPVATDLAGQVIWYYAPGYPWHRGPIFTRPVAGGTMLVITDGIGGLPQQLVREVDLAGNIVRETNAARVSEQLVALGQDPIDAFHHEVVRFPNGYTLVLGAVERMLVDVQGSEPVDIVGDMVIALDDNWQVIWAWNTFDHLDVTRRASLNEDCSSRRGILLFLDACARDWTHSNSIAYSPSDGNLLLSVRNQDWVIKIDYRDGAGTGDIIWRLGLDGDFTIYSSDPYPWFTHQHDAHYEGEQIVLYDNGNLRCETSSNPLQDCYSRGQVLNVNENARVVTLALNADLGNYSIGLGAAQKMLNGNFHFTSGAQPGLFATSDELLPDGSKVFSIGTWGTLYRSFRMTDLYTP